MSAMPRLHVYKYKNIRLQIFRLIFSILPAIEETIEMRPVDNDRFQVTQSDPLCHPLVHTTG